MKLTEIAIRKAKPAPKPYKIADGGGMYLEVMPNGSKYWRLKYRFVGKEKRLALGVYPDVSIDDARAARDAMKLQLIDGIDPSLQRRLERQTELVAAVEAHALRRFAISNDGSLAIRLGKRIVTLTFDEAAELRRFLNATSTVQPPEDKSCL